MRLSTWILTAALLFAFHSASAVPPKTDSCIKCHAGLDKKNAAIVAACEQDIHFQRGLSCADCHGGDPSKPDEDAMDPDLGFTGTPKRAEIPHFCSKCHSNPNYMRHFNPRINVDQEEKYATSHHGKLLAKGDPKVAMCTSCHGVHGILAVESTESPVHKSNIPATCNRCHGDKSYMASYGIPTNQYEEFSQSVHGVALLQKRTKGAPACNDCHGNHGASPPGVDDVAAVCILCHSFNGELFNKSPHKAAFAKAGFSQCAQCHNHHKIVHPTDEMLGVGKGAVCVECHAAGEQGYIAAARIKTLLDSLKVEQVDATSMLAEAKALDMDVVEGETAVEEIRENLIASRTAIHAFSDEHMAEVCQKGFDAASRADSIAKAAIFEFKFRRVGFGVATLILTGLALLLWLKIRQIEKRQRAARSKEKRN